jgi:hypothetical protein
MNAGRPQTVFTDATAKTGLDSETCGAGLNGFFAPGYWNDDARMDLFYAGGKTGLLLIQNSQGKFKPAPHNLRFDFRTTNDFADGLTGAASIAAVRDPDAVSLVCPDDHSLRLIVNEGKLKDVTHDGNEIRIGGTAQTAALTEDLNMNGYVDVLTITRGENAEIVFLTNRGYGSFMRPELYSTDKSGFSGNAHKTGAWGAAAGDIDGDGDNDLVLAGVNGQLTVLSNQVLEHRKPIEHPGYHEAKLLQTASVSVVVKGKVGVLGAHVTLKNRQDDIIALRMIGSQVLTGCRGPDTLTLAVREPGHYTLTVRFSDGHAQSWPVVVKSGARMQVTAARTHP